VATVDYLSGESLKKLKKDTKRKHPALLNRKRLKDGIVDVRFDVLLEGRVAPLLPLNPLLFGQHTDTITTGTLHHLARNDEAGVADALNARVDETLVDLISVEAAGEGGGRCVDHVVGYAAGLGENGTQADTREDVDVVALVGVVGNGVVARLDREAVERRARGKDDGAVGPVDGLLEGALGLGERVAEREKDGPAAETASVDRSLEGADDRLGEDAKGRRQADQGRWLDVLNNLLERAELVAVVVCPSKILLVLGELVAAVLGHEALSVDEPELVPGCLLRKAALGVELHQLLGDTHTCGTGSHEHETLLLNRHPGKIDGANVPA
jgi:hypothetical protein